MLLWQKVKSDIVHAFEKPFLDAGQEITSLCRKVSVPFTGQQDDQRRGLCKICRLRANAIQPTSGDIEEC